MLKERFKKTMGRFSGDDPLEYEERPEVPEGLFRKCPSCGKIVYEEDVKEKLFCCPECGKHFRIDARTRIKMIADAGSYEEWDADMTTDNPLGFPGYEAQLAGLMEETGKVDAVITGKARIYGIQTALGVMSSDFMMASMGTVVGERITRMIERATEEDLPVVLFCCSGGARMEEGIFSLMQMAKISQAIKRHDEKGLMYIPVLTDPTTGGVTASFAMLGDVIIAEPGALIGFAGQRVIAQTIGQKLPKGFQSAEFQRSHGFIDLVVKRKSVKTVLRVLLESAGGTYGRK